MKTVSVVALLSAIQLGAFLFGGRREKPVVLTDQPPIDAISVVSGIVKGKAVRHIDVNKPERRIKDRETIEQFVRFINRRDTGWHKPRATEPAGDYTVVVEREGETIAVFRMNSRFIGGKLNGESNRYRDLDPDEWDVLKGILKLSAK